ncbi:MAG TPA: pyridoxal phosphate-dependent aminotransferase [Blattabacteriaceae bacterium]
MKNISYRLKNMSFSKTLYMANIARNLINKGYKNIINLGIGEPDFNPPGFVLHAAKKAIDDGYHKYSPISGYYDLRETICKKFKRDNELNYNPSQIVVSTGVKQSIINIFLSILNPEDEVIIPAPYWVSYYEMIKLCEAKPVIIHTDRKKNFKVTAIQLEKSINSKTRAFIFSSPSNPSGGVYSKSELKALAKILSKHKNIMIVSDEIYEHICYKSHASIASIPEVYDQTITSNGISKAFSMTGWRIGYIGAPEWIAQACEKVQGQMTSGANSLSQRAAIAALAARIKSISMIVSLKKRRNLVLEFIDKITGFQSNIPKGTFYVFPDVSNLLHRNISRTLIKNSDDLALILLEKIKVLTIGGSSFGKEKHLRISYAMSESKLLDAFRRMKNLFYGKN